MTDIDLVKIVEGALMAAGKPLTAANIADLFEEHERPDTSTIREAFKTVGERCEDRGFELHEVASGFRFQVRQSLSPWVARLWHERPQKYSRAMLETLSLIAYRQPITRGEIEEIRGVAVSSNIVKTLHEREWIRVVGHRDVPGRPAMYATTRQFLDYFNLKTLDQLPALAEIRDFDTLTAELGFADLEATPDPAADAATAQLLADSEAVQGDDVVSDGSADNQASDPATVTEPESEAAMDPTDNSEQTSAEVPELDAQGDEAATEPRQVFESGH